MPLPPNCTLSLLGHSRPGDTVHSRPKQAIIIRLSSETLDAIEMSSAVQIDFSHSPALWIGPSNFIMNATKENLHHELYLRTAVAARKNVPLKLHANVVGKFQVERQLDNETRTRLRQSTRSLQEQRQERGIIQLETPPAHVPSKIRKLSAKSPRQARSVQDDSSTSQRDGKGTSAIIRRKMVQLLAASDHTYDEMVELLNGSENTTCPLDISDLLEQVAEPIPRSDSGPKSKIYRLKANSWLEVRPYDWEGLNEDERSAIATKVAQALKRMNIPETDSAWEQASRRKGKSTLPTSSIVAQRAISLKHDNVTPRVVVSHKEKRSKSKTGVLGDHEAMNGDNIKTAITHARDKGSELAGQIQTVSKAPIPLRRLPGSGYKLPKPSRVTFPDTEVLDHPHRAPVDGVRSRHQLTLEHATVAVSQGRIIDGTHYTAPKKVDNPPVDSSADNSVDAGSLRILGKDYQKKYIETSNVSYTSKRRSDDSDASTKKRKIEPSGNKTLASGRKKVKEDRENFSVISTVEARIPSPYSAAPTEVTVEKRKLSKNISSIKRRRSPIYTSSDDEGEPVRQKSKKSSSVHPPIDRTTTDRASMRRRYSSLYGEYLTTFHKLVTSKDSILRKYDVDRANSISESDPDIELDYEEFGRLYSHHSRLRDELETIRQLYVDSLDE
ncbi:hypothetical protein AMATHDRAFT_7882 [Amanita thiersii Skay4041]|uniref:RNA polymerase II elongation factor ELL N-terminal domain-containing protein n=1 Tax=Amanita thiersii Skay4041 TaxID=703135 RepID=A0A2A9NDS4_9AGAR|nr:hypothetical protein AMATHDRAFT_7882 [Amanita thiersii Skay4041]